MSMIISQEYMETYVINPLNKRLNEIETKIDLIKSDIKLLTNDFDKVIKTMKKVK